MTGVLSVAIRGEFVSRCNVDAPSAGSADTTGLLHYRACLRIGIEKITRMSTFTHISKFSSSANQATPAVAPKSKSRSWMCDNRSERLIELRAQDQTWAFYDFFWRSRS
jgi:hypothetical protein